MYTCACIYIHKDTDSHWSLQYFIVIDRLHFDSDTYVHVYVYMYIKPGGVADMLCVFCADES